MYSGPILKLRTELKSVIEYELPIGEELVGMNKFIGKYIHFEWKNEILCISCGRKTNKSFAQGYCYPCFLNSPETSECILRPELCEAHEGKARDMKWAKNHCLQPHYVYLAVSSGIKVGITRYSQIPTRWIDQGASFAIKIAETPNRFISGIIEVALKEFVSDRTAWQKMLKNQVLEEFDLIEKKHELFSKLNSNLQKFKVEDDKITEINYPVLEFPKKVKSIGFDKFNEIAGRIMGIKGQYLIFDDNTVLNIRKHNGYVIEMKL
tara:strand:- start:3258 stop:4052 length:795 start_codon:yes stop_codon:yes gene_type:complete